MVEFMTSEGGVLGSVSTSAISYIHKQKNIYVMIIKGGWVDSLWWLACITL